MSICSEGSLDTISCHISIPFISLAFAPTTGASFLASSLLMLILLLTSPVKCPSFSCFIGCSSQQCPSHYLGQQSLKRTRFWEGKDNSCLHWRLVPILPNTYQGPLSCHQSAMTSSASVSAETKWTYRTGMLKLFFYFKNGKWTPENASSLPSFGSDFL